MYKFKLWNLPQQLNELGRRTTGPEINTPIWGTILISGFFGLFQEKEEEKPESELIMAIKRAVLLIQVYNCKVCSVNCFN